MNNVSWLSIVFSYSSTILWPNIHHQRKFENEAFIIGSFVQKKILSILGIDLLQFMQYWNCLEETTYFLQKSQLISSITYLEFFVKCQKFGLYIVTSVLFMPLKTVHFKNMVANLDPVTQTKPILLPIFDTD